MPTSPLPNPPLRAMLTDRLGRWSIRSAQILLIAILVAAAVFALVQVRVLVIPVLIAIILAAAAAPIVARLRRAGLPPVVAAWIVLLGALLVLGAIVTGVVLAVRNRWDEIVDSAGEGFDELRSWAETLPIPVDSAQWRAVGEQVTDFLTSPQFGTGALAGVAAAVEVVAGSLLLVVLLFFFLKDGDRIWAFLLRGFSADRRIRGERIGTVSVRVLGGYARGTVIIALVDALVIGATLLILQVPLAVPLAALVFVGAFVPIVGATVTGILAVLVALVTNGVPAATIVAIVVVLVNQLEGDLLQPLVMSQSLRLHPLVILVALTAGTLVGGIAGAVLAVPIAAVTWAIVSNWDGPAPAAGPRRRRRGLGSGRGEAIEKVESAT